MISRRKILSRSLDNLDSLSPAEEEEDVWYDKDKLCRDHIQEILEKWTQIDDEIWAKIIVFERNRRVAKAYARSPVITINGSKNGFDGMRIGLNGFDNPMRDAKTSETKKLIGDGFKLKMDETGSILIKRYGKSNVYVQNSLQNPNEETVIGADILQLPNRALQTGKSATLFDIKKFSVNISREFSRSYPDRRRLERQCLSAVSLVKSNDNLLNSPIWILVINVVAIDMLKSKMMAFPKLFAIENRCSPPSSSNHDDPPYSTIDSQAELMINGGSGGGGTTSGGSGTTSGGSGVGGIPENIYHVNPKNGKKLPTEEYFNDPKIEYEPLEKERALKPMRVLREKDSKPRQRKKQDDPYYCGLLARIPNFIKSSSSRANCKNKQLQHHQQQLLHQQQRNKDETKLLSTRKFSAQHNINHISYPLMPIASIHQYASAAALGSYSSSHGRYPHYKLYPHNHPLSQSQISLWDSRRIISGID